jgi:hypothetical protein
MKNTNNIVSLKLATYKLMKHDDENCFDLI